MRIQLKCTDINQGGFTYIQNDENPGYKEIVKIFTADAKWGSPKGCSNDGYLIGN